MGEQDHDEDDSRCRGAQPIEHRACGGAERFVTLMADAALPFPRMDIDIAPADLTSGMAVPVRAACHREVHDTPPGCAWKHCHEQYVWPPVFFTIPPHHGWVWSYLCARS